MRFKSCLVSSLIFFVSACSVDKPKTPMTKTAALDANGSSEGNSSPNNQTSENPADNGKTQVKSAMTATANNPPATGGSPAPSPPSPQAAGTCPPFPTVTSPINGGGSNCSQSCVDKLNAVHQYLTGLGSTISKPTDSNLKKTPSVAKSFFKELNTHGQQVGCNPLEGKSYR